MARNHAGGGYLDKSSGLGVSAASPLTIAGWFFFPSGVVPGYDVFATLFNTGDGWTSARSLACDGSGHIQAVNSGLAATQSLAIPSDAWFFAAGVFGANGVGVDVWQGTTKVSNGGTSLPALAPNFFQVGVSPTGGSVMQGYSAYLSVWLAALSDGTLTALAGGALPSAYTTDLYDTWELGLADPEVGDVNGQTLDSVGAAAVAGPTLGGGGGEEGGAYRRSRVICVL